MYSTLVLLCMGWMSNVNGQEKKGMVALEQDASQFVNITDVVPDAILEIRYFSTYNFVAQRTK